MENNLVSFLSSSNVFDHISEDYLKNSQIISTRGPLPARIIQIPSSIFDNIPYRRLKKSIFQLGGLKTKYLRFYSVLPNMTQYEFNNHMKKVRKLAKSL